MFLSSQVDFIGEVDFRFVSCSASSRASSVSHPAARCHGWIWNWAAPLNVQWRSKYTIFLCLKTIAERLQILQYSNNIQSYSLFWCLCLYLFGFLWSHVLLLRNLSSALIDTLVTLYDDALERIAGQEKLRIFWGEKLPKSPRYGTLRRSLSITIGFFLSHLRDSSE